MNSNRRQKERHHSGQEITKPTLYAEDVEERHSTTNTNDAEHAHILIQKCEDVRSY